MSLISAKYGWRDESSWLLNRSSIHGPPNSPGGKLIPCTTSKLTSPSSGRAFRFGDSALRACSTQCSLTEYTFTYSLAQCLDSSVTMSALAVIRRNLSSPYCIKSPLNGPQMKAELTSACYCNESCSNLRLPRFSTHARNTLSITTRERRHGRQSSRKRHTRIHIRHH